MHQPRRHKTCKKSTVCTRRRLNAVVSISIALIFLNCGILYANGYIAEHNFICLRVNPGVSDLNTDFGIFKSSHGKYSFIGSPSIDKYSELPISKRLYVGFSEMAGGTLNRYVWNQRSLVLSNISRWGKERNCALFRYGLAHTAQVHFNSRGMTGIFPFNAEHCSVTKVFPCIFLRGVKKIIGNNSIERHPSSLTFFPCVCLNYKSVNRSFHFLGLITRIVGIEACNKDNQNGGYCLYPTWPICLFIIALSLIALGYCLILYSLAKFKPLGWVPCCIAGLLLFALAFRLVHVGLTLLGE